MGDKYMDYNMPERIAVLPVSDTVIFPRMVVPLLIKTEDNSALIENALGKDKMILIVMSKRDEESENNIGDIHHVGTLAKVVKLTRNEDDFVLVLQGLDRVRILEIETKVPYMIARIMPFEDTEIEESESRHIDALAANLIALLGKFSDFVNMPQEILQLIRNIDQPGLLADVIVSIVPFPRHQKQEILESFNLYDRLEKLTRFLDEQIALYEMGREIHQKVKKDIDQNQREYYLKEQLKAIQRELGFDDNLSETDELRMKINEKSLPAHVKEAAEKELVRFDRMNPSSAEYSVSHTYIDWLIDLPWQESTEDKLDLKCAESILNEYHYGLEKVKKRILEYLAVRKLNPKHKGSILCFVGPPGTGKTSLGRAIANAMGRNFVRQSLGGVRDEAEIRGHRRTYVGALPGRIIQEIKKAGSNNPVFMLDEIDKLGSDFRGDPSSALLEVLDPEQNFSFEDHYLDLEFDLSKVMFICTANHMDTIPSALKDRMEVIELSGYTEEEKYFIAKRYLVPRQIAENGLSGKVISFRPAAIRKILNDYTKEAGVRTLERKIAAVCRGVARKIASGEDERFIITGKATAEYLGHPDFRHDSAEQTSTPGVAVGMAWTPTGGDILFIEATKMPGQKSLVLTGQLGDVMKESAQTALSYLRSNASALNISNEVFKNSDLHIHVPAGAVPKDGPSAGVTMFTALASLLTDRPVKKKLAMTGEVTLRGNVLPVGGIKDKILAAKRGGIKEIILPKENMNDLDDIPEKIRQQMVFHTVSKMDEILNIALDKKQVKGTHRISTA